MKHADTEHDDRLIVRHDLRLVKTVELKAGSYTVGRSSQCDITLGHDAVSRHHARFERRSDGWYVIDTDSANGVLVNGQRIQESRLLPGDVIEIRPFSMNYLAEHGTRHANGDRSVTFAGRSVTPTIVRDVARAAHVPVKQRLEDLYALSRLLIRRTEDGTFWPRVHAALQRSLAADRCVLVGVDSSAGMYRLAPRARSTEDQAPLELSRSVLNTALESGQALLIQNVNQDSRFAAAQSLAISATRSVICAPIMVQGRARAAVYADRRHSQPPFDEDDLDFVVAAVDLASTAVEMDELHVSARELSRVHGRIEAAREMQKLLLPNPLPQPTWGRVAARNYPADQMSGDTYDAFLDKAGRLVVSLADVAGKGVPAAFVTAMLQDALRQCAVYLDNLGDIMQRLNESMCTYNTAGRFATMVVCRWSPDGNVVEIANAGHHAPLWVRRSGHVEAFPERVGLILGYDARWIGEIVHRDASTDIIMLLSSDGATEARSPDDNEYGLCHLADRLAKLHREDAEDIANGLLGDVRSFCSPREPMDDVTLLIVKRNT